MYRTKHIVEYIGLRIIAAIFNILPYRLALAFACFLAALSFYIFRFRRSLAEHRIRSVLGPSCTPTRARAIAWQSWKNTFFSAVEMFRMHKINRNWVDRYCDGDKLFQTLQEHARSGRGAVIAAPHMGSWEMAALACTIHGLPVFSVAGRQKNPLTSDFFLQYRRSHNIQVIERGSGALRDILRKISAGGMLAILPDLRHRTPDVSAPFLGGTANVSSSIATFARHCDVPVFPCVVTRQGWSRHVFTIHPPVVSDKKLDKKQDVETMTRAVLEIMDRSIRQDPGQWFWFNKRWILDPVEPIPEQELQQEGVKP